MLTNLIKMWLLSFMFGALIGNSIRYQHPVLYVLAACWAGVVVYYFYHDIWRKIWDGP